jgi:hypothetical protein
MKNLPWQQEKNSSQLGNPPIKYAKEDIVSSPRVVEHHSLFVNLECPIDSSMMDIMPKELENTWVMVVYSK